MDFFQDIKSVILGPTEFFCRQAEEKTVKRGLIAASVICVIGFFIELIAMMSKPELASMLGGQASLFFLLLLPILLLVSFLFMAIGVGIIHLLAKLFGGVGTFKALYACTLFSQAAVGLLSIPITLMNACFLSASSGSPATAIVIILMGIGLCMFFWMVYLSVIMIKICHRLSNAKAIMALLSPILVVFLFFGLLIMIYQ